MKKAGDLLAAFLDERVLNAAREYSELFSSWQSIAGDKIASHSRIRELEHSVLLVEADHPGWIQILQTKEKDLLDTLRRRFPDRNITGISFRLSREPPVPSAGPQPVNDAVPGPAARDGEALVDSDTADGDPYEKITDDHFKEALKRLEERIASRNKG
jgi:predicted nucleic acid-binding Zn ribbon protein